MVLFYYQKCKRCNKPGKIHFHDSEMERLADRFANLVAKKVGIRAVFKEPAQRGSNMRSNHKASLC